EEEPHERRDHAERARRHRGVDHHAREGDGETPAVRPEVAEQPEVGLHALGVRSGSAISSRARSEPRKSSSVSSGRADRRPLVTSWKTMSPTFSPLVIPHSWKTIGARAPNWSR